MYGAPQVRTEKMEKILVIIVPDIWGSEVK